MPVIRAFETALNQGLLLESERHRHYFAFDTTELLKGDILKRYQAYQIGLANNFLQADEVRYKEDLKPLGFNFIRLGLQDVLLDPKTNTIYTPNTNQTTMFGQNVNQQVADSMNEETEQRWDGQPRDSDGRFDKGKRRRLVRSGAKRKNSEKSSERLEKLDKNDIIKEKSYKPITKITDSAITRVPKVNIRGYTEEQCSEIQRQHKELLRYSKNNNNNKEVAFVFDSSISKRKEFVGSDDMLDFGSSLHGKDLLVMHNHPRNSSYSDTDIAFLLENDNVRSLSIVKNNGSVEILTKSSSFDKEKAINEFKRSYKKYVKSGKDSEIDKAVNKFISKYTEGLLWIESQ